MTIDAKPAAVLFDLDGTLIDSEPYWISQETKLMASFGCTWTHEDALALVGQPLAEGAAIMKRHAEIPMEIPDMVDYLMNGVISCLEQEIPWRPGARELLADARANNIPIALVTMSYREIAAALFAGIGENPFDVVVTGDMVVNGKPDPEAYLLAAKELGVNVTDCLAVEDSIPGVASAVSSGARTIAVPHVVELPEHSDYLRIETLADANLMGLWATASAHLQSH